MKIVIKAVAAVALLVLLYSSASNWADSVLLAAATMAGALFASLSEKGIVSEFQIFTIIVSAMAYNMGSADPLVLIFAKALLALVLALILMIIYVIKEEPEEKDLMPSFDLLAGLKDPINAIVFAIGFGAAVFESYEGYGNVWVPAIILVTLLITVTIPVLDSHVTEILGTVVLGCLLVTAIDFVSYQKNPDLMTMCIGIIFMHSALVGVDNIKRRLSNDFS